mmetsp:Transcript_34263/g.75404  ORF Transcript_34263/g.75404 Transcript_34263/m.75404 type:complete len:310 (-) Transcript_34263:57-986(-)
MRCQSKHYQVTILTEQTVPCVWVVICPGPFPSNKIHDFVLSFPRYIRAGKNDGQIRPSWILLELLLDEFFYVSSTPIKEWRTRRNSIGMEGRTRTITSLLSCAAFICVFCCKMLMLVIAVSISQPTPMGRQKQIIVRLQMIPLRLECTRKSPRRHLPDVFMTVHGSQCLAILCRGCRNSAERIPLFLVQVIFVSISIESSEDDFFSWSRATALLLLRRGSRSQVRLVEGGLNFPLLAAPIPPRTLLIHLSPGCNAVNGQINQLSGLRHVTNNPIEIVANILEYLFLGYCHGPRRIFCLTWVPDTPLCRI